MDTDFPSGSRNKRDHPAEPEPPKKIEAVIESEVLRRRRPLGRRISETFGGGDARGVVQYVMLDVVAPALRDLVVDGVTQGMERLVFGDVRSGARRAAGRPSGSSGYVSYNRFSQPNNRREEARPSISRRGRSMHDFDEIILATRAEGNEVIRRMDDLIQKYEQVTVSDLYQLVDIAPSFTDEKWGWTDIREARVERTRAGYLLDLPRPELLD